MKNSARHIKRPIRPSNRGEVSAHAGDRQKTPVSPARSPQGALFLPARQCRYLLLIIWLNEPERGSWGSLLT